MLLMLALNLFADFCKYPSLMPVLVCAAVVTLIGLYVLHAQEDQRFWLCPGSRWKHTTETIGRLNPL